MRIETTYNLWEYIQNNSRHTAVRVLEDPKTHKKVTEVVVYLYTKVGDNQDIYPSKGKVVDVSV